MCLIFELLLKILKTFVSSCRPRIVAHSATQGFQDIVVGTATLTKGEKVALQHSGTTVKCPEE